MARGGGTGVDKKTPDHELIFKQEGICQDRPRPSLIHNQASGNKSIQVY